MRWWIAFVLFSSLLAGLDGLMRLVSLGRDFPSPGQLQQRQLTLQELSPKLQCPSPPRGRKGGKGCSWVISLAAQGGEVWRVFLPPLLEPGRSSYALLQAGDRLEVGLFQGKVYTLRRLAAAHPSSDLAQRLDILDEAQLQGWRGQWRWRQFGWLALDLGAIVLVGWLFRRHRQSVMAGLLLMPLLSVLCLLLLPWSWRPAPLPAQQALQTQRVQFVAAGLRLECSSVWLLESLCEPQVLLFDRSMGVWPIAYLASTALVDGERIGKGEWLQLGVHNGKVYRIARDEPPEVEAVNNCGYRQNPLARRSQVIWICDDQLKVIDKGRNPLHSFLQEKDPRLLPRPRQDPLPYEWSLSAYQAEVRSHNELMLLTVLIPLGVAILISLLRAGRRP